ncbi:MAG: hypothetical protein WC155_00825 [Candidatus Cloacimonadales bacterium]
MKKLVLLIILASLSLLLFGEVITDELWLKAVKLKNASFDIYPSTTTYKSIIKDKKGTVQQEITILIAHTEKDGNIINSFVEGQTSDEPLTADDEAVAVYLGTDVLVKEAGIFKTETNEDFKLTRVADEMLEGKEYAKYQITQFIMNEKKKIKSEGFIWLDAITGIPLKMVADIEPNHMMVKSINMTTTFSLTKDGYLVADEKATDVNISVVFKKMNMTQVVTSKGFKKVGGAISN